MKRLSLIALLGLAIAGCASGRIAEGQPGAGTQAAATGVSSGTIAPGLKRRTPPSDGIRMADEAGTVLVQPAKLRPGVSSATVEKLARRFGCTGSAGAGLLTAEGPLEIYRLKCDDGTTFTAQCELRQCRPLR